MIDRRGFGLLGIGLTLAACTRAVADPGAVRIAVGATIDSLDPLLSIDAYPLFRSIFDSLTEIRADGSLGPRLARSWTANSDATEWHFRIRDDACWSDGSPVTLADIRFSLETIRTNPASLNHQYLTGVDTIAAMSPDTIRFRLARPFAAWPRQLTLLSIVPEGRYRAIGPASFSQRPTGSGPYRVERWSRGISVDLVANPHHAGGPPPISRVSVLSIPEEAARLSALQSGDIDAITVTPQQVAMLEGRPGIDIQRTRSNRVTYLGFATGSRPLNDLRVRQAIDCAIDRDAICRYLLRRTAMPIGQLVAPGTFGFDDSAGVVGYDPAKARRLLAAAGQGTEPIVFQYPANGSIPLVGFVAEAIQGYLSAVGLTVQMRPMEQSMFIGDWLGAKLQGMYLFAFNPSTMDAGLVTSSLIGPGGVRSFSDAEMDRLEAGQMTQTDPVARAATFSQIWARNRDRVYYAPLFNDLYVYATARDRLALLPRRDGYITAHELGLPRPRSHI